MSGCDTCPMAEKIYECCGRFPETGESVDFFLEENIRFSACPHLNTDGRCAIYSSRPLACRMHTCTVLSFF